MTYTKRFPIGSHLPPDPSALRARGKLLLPFCPRVTSGPTAKGAVLKPAEAEVTRYFRRSSSGSVLSAGAVAPGARDVQLLLS